MPNPTKIQWTNFTSNPIRYKNADGLDVWACVKVSDGCTNCYAETLALSSRMASAGRAVGARFNAGEMAKLTPYVADSELHAIVASRKITGKRVFLGDMTDIFGEWVTDEMLDQVFAAMALRPDVTFQVLTKRPERAREYVDGTGRTYPGTTVPKVKGKVWSAASFFRVIGGEEPTPWPLPNVWLGTTVEDQAAADARIPVLLDTPAAVRFLSCEPLLGPVDLPFIGTVPRDISPRYRLVADMIDWVIVGGESGSKARETNIEAIRSVVRQCQAAGVAVFVKQMGSRPVGVARCRGCGEWNPKRGRPGYEEVHDLYTDACGPVEDVPKLRHSHGGDPAEWPADLRVREWPQ